MFSLVDSVENGFSMEFLARKGPVDTKAWCTQFIENLPSPDAGKEPPAVLVW
jgi:hypothetical protein